MEKNTMEKQDYIELKTFYNTAKSIETLYKKLYDLEIQDKKESKEYKDNIEYLKIALEVEKEQYKDFPKNINKSKIWGDYLIKDRMPKDFFGNTDSIMQLEYSNRPVKRIIKKLINILLKYDKITIIQSIDNIYKTFDHLDIGEINYVLPTFTEKDVSLIINIKHEIKMTFLIFLEEYIQNPIYDKIKNELIKVKYNYSFIEPELENVFYANKFTVPKKFEIKSKNFAEYNNLDPNIYNILRSCYGKKMAMDQIYDLLQITDNDYKYVPFIILSIVKLCMVRAGASVLDGMFLEDLYYDYYNEIEDSDIKNNEISKKSILKCLNNINEDVNKIKKITF